MDEKELDKLAAETVAAMKAAGKVVSAEDIAGVKEAFKKKEGEPQGFLGIPGFIKRMLAGVQKVRAIIGEVVDAVEVVAADIKLAGADKKALAVKILNLLIDIPYVPEKLEPWVFEYTIDVIVGELNRRLGNNWYQKLKQLSGNA